MLLLRKQEHTELLLLIRDDRAKYVVHVDIVLLVSVAAEHAKNRMKDLAYNVTRLLQPRQARMAL